MRFTRRTYGIAIRRALKLECTLLNEYARAFRGPHAWHKQQHLTNALRARRAREL